MARALFNVPPKTPSVVRLWTVASLSDLTLDWSGIEVGDTVYDSGTGRYYKVLNIGEGGAHALVPISLGASELDPNIAIEVADASGTTQAVTITFTDANGNAVSPLCRVWASDGDFAVTAAAAAAGVTVSTGSLVSEITTDSEWLIVPTSGTIVLTFDNDQGGAAYTDTVVVAVGPIIAESDALAVPNSA